MRCSYACGSAEHQLSRRGFLGGSRRRGARVRRLVQPAVARQLDKAQKRVLLVWLSGGSSQLETWDPKPGTDTGGPFQAIATSVPGVHICELLPYTARQMHHMALVRGVNTAEDDHGKGTIIMHTGRQPGAAQLNIPHLGVGHGQAARQRRQPAAGLHPRHARAAAAASARRIPPSSARSTPASPSPTASRPPTCCRPATLSRRPRPAAQRCPPARSTTASCGSRRTAETEAYTQSFDQAAQVMQQRDVFDITREPTRAARPVRQRTTSAGTACWPAACSKSGVTFVKVTHTNYDTHHENFDFHIEQLGEFDRTFATLLDDLDQRGLLETTLVIVMSEFGRTPTINRNYGRDHWSQAWSVALAGCGIKGGAVVGKTNANGTAVTDREVNGGHLFHTYFRALGLNPKQQPLLARAADPDGRPQGRRHHGGARMNASQDRSDPGADGRRS